MLRAAVRQPLRLLALGASPDHIQAAIQSTGRAGILRIRTTARDRADGMWLPATGLVIPKDPVTPDLHRADRSAAALGRAWRKNLEQELEAHPYRTAARRASDDLEPSVDRTALTEAVDGWDAQTRRIADHAEALGHLVTETWCAALDSNICPRCKALDGEVRTRPDRFELRPPIHPRCACLVDIDIVSAWENAA